jgi:hypothetical protein
MIERGFVYRGLKPVNWCFDCNSALAEAEVEYADKVSPVVDVAFPLEPSEAARVAQIFGVPALDKPCSTVIWTTTPWTLPANQALNIHPELVYALVDCADRCLVLGEALVAACLQRFGLEGKVVGTARGARSSACAFAIRWRACIRATTARPRSTWALRQRRGRHRRRAFGPGLRRGGLPVLQAVRHGQRGSSTRCKATACTPPTCRCSAACASGTPIAKIIDALRQAGQLLHAAQQSHSYMHCWRHKTPLIYRAAPQWFVRMDGATADTRGVLQTETVARRCARRAARHRGHRVLSGLGQGAAAQHDRQPSGLVHLAPAQLGRAAALFLAPDHGTVASAHARTARAGRAARRARRHRSLVAGAQRGRAAGRGSRAVRQGQRHPGRLVRFGFDPSHGHARIARAKARLPGGHVPRRLRPASRLVPFLAADRLGHRRARALPRAADARLHRRCPGPQDEQEPGQRHRSAAAGRQDGRRDHSPVGGRDRLFGRDVDRRRDPQARGRVLPAHPQHAALLAGQHERL